MGILSSLFGSSDNTALIESLKKNPFLVDVRTPSEFSGGSVKGAVNIPLDQLSSQMAKFKGKENIVVFCRSGGRSSQAKSILNSNGHNNVINGDTWQNVQGALIKK